MKQSPSNLKFKKFHKPNSAFLRIKEQRSFLPFYGHFALKALEHGRLTFKQIEAARRTIRRTSKKAGSL
jgi:large subunit ribosomal protein L16